MCELDQLEVRVSDRDPSQLDDLRVAHAAAVVASRDGLVVADVKAGSLKTRRNRDVTPSSVHWGSKILLLLGDAQTSNPAECGADEGLCRVLEGLEGYSGPFA